MKDNHENESCLTIIWREKKMSKKVHSQKQEEKKNERQKKILKRETAKMKTRTEINGEFECRYTTKEKRSRKNSHKLQQQPEK